MLLYIIKRDVLMYAIPYLTCNVHSLLLLPKSEAETQLNAYLFFLFFFPTGQKGNYIHL